MLHTFSSLNDMSIPTHALKVAFEWGKKRLICFQEKAVNNERGSAVPSEHFQMTWVQAWGGHNMPPFGWIRVIE